jgi:hypothetical protein
VLVLRPNLLNTTSLIAKIPTRRFAKIEPQRLRRLRALLLAREVSAGKHWRCLIANATADDASFAELRNQSQEAPEFLVGAMKVASYRGALFEAVHGLVRDDFDPYRRTLAKVPVERFMTERFADIPVPPSAAEQLALRDRLKQVVLRARDEAVKTALPFAEADFVAFVCAMSHDAEAKQLFCLN